MNFEITTNKETAEKIRKECEWGVKMGCRRSYELGEISHHDSVLGGYGYSIVQIKAIEGKPIKPSDIFFLGLFCADR